AAIGNNGAGSFHDRLPVGIGHVRHQDVAGLHQIHLRYAGDNLSAALANTVAHAAALGQHLALLLEPVTLHFAFDPALHRLRPGLEDIEFAVESVLGPFDVHRPLVMLFDAHREPRQLFHFAI